MTSSDPSSPHGPRWMARLPGSGSVPVFEFPALCAPDPLPPQPGTRTQQLSSHLPDIMGIKQLNDLITEEAPDSITSTTPETYRGKVLAIDASIFIHQFDSAVPHLINRHGEEIQVLQGFFQRTVFMLQNGIKPVYVFDGIPPENKRLRVIKDGKVQTKRRVNPALTPGSEKYKDLKTLLTFLGVPFIQAPGEAEASCAHLVVKNLAWGAVTEDMDALPFGCQRLIRNLRAKKKIEVKEYNLSEILKHLKLSREQFVDLCILLGCDYAGKIKGLGRKKALKMIQTHKTIEGVLQVIEAKDKIPPDFHYATARNQFLAPAVTECEDLKWTKPDEEKILHFLSREKRIKEFRVLKVLEQLHPAPKQKPQKRGRKSTEASSSKQMKLSSYFPVKKSAHQAKRAGGPHPTLSME